MVKIRLLAVLAAVSVWGGPALAAPNDDAVAVREAQRFCQSNADNVADVKHLLQIQRLVLTEHRIAVRIEELKAATEETRRWIEQRDGLLGKVREQLVEIYGKMRPDAAALQLAALDDDTAVALIVRLQPRAASAILAEMEARRAATLAAAVQKLKTSTPDKRGDGT